MPAKPLLSVQGLRVEIPTRRGVLLALDDISFDIAPGEILGFVGESGAGKSLTGMAILGLLDPPGRIAGGEIRLQDRRIDQLPPHEMRRLRGKEIADLRHSEGRVALLLERYHARHVRRRHAGAAHLRDAVGRVDPRRQDFGPCSTCRAGQGEMHCARRPATCLPAALTWGKREDTRADVGEL